MIKTRRGRLRSGSARRKARKDYCEVCFDTEELSLHHIVEKRNNGPDHKYNLIMLCEEHHIQAHEDILSRCFFFSIVSAREGKPIDSIIATVYRIVYKGR